MRKFDRSIRGRLVFARSKVHSCNKLLRSTRAAHSMRSRCASQAAILRSRTYCHAANSTYTAC